MSAAHTPGPWSLRPDSTGFWIEAHQPAWMSYPSGIRPVSLDARHECGEANASLIAAAPDLLAACKSAISAWTDGAECEISNAIGLLEYAIAKAERTT